MLQRSLRRTYNMRTEYPTQPATAEAQTKPTSSTFTADDIYKAIAEGLLAYDLRNEPLSDLRRSRVYRDAATLEFARRLEVPAAAADVLPVRGHSHDCPGTTHF